MTSTLTELKAELKSRLRLENEVQADGVSLKPDGRNLVGLCPFHDESTASFKIDAKKEIFKCFGCGAKGDVLNWISFRLFKKFDTTGAEFVAVLKEACKRAGIAFPERNDAPEAAKPAPAVAAPSKPKTVYATIAKLRGAVDWRANERGETVTEWNEYANPESGVELVTIRLERDGKKSFLQAAPVAGGFSFGGISTGKNPLFERTQILESKFADVIVVEGEKCVRALQVLGFLATTSPGGANSARKADWTALAGKSVTIWPDDDGSGEGYAADVLTELQALIPVPTIRVIDPKPLNLGDGGDVADFLERIQGDDAAKFDAVVEVLNVARAIGPLADLDAVFADAVAGRRKNIPFVWPEISAATRALLPASVTIFCGGPGATKSLSLVQNLQHWSKAGVPVVALMLEDGAAYHLRRAMAQIAEKCDLTDDDFCRANPAIVAEFQKATRNELEALTHCIEAPKADNPLTVDSLLAWVNAKAAAGNRVICIDPITAMNKGQFGFNDDQKFMLGAKRIIEEHRASLFLVSHPRKASAGQRAAAVALADLAGGAAYERFSHAVLYLLAHNPKKVTVGCSFARQEVSANRTITILKARNSYGAGLQIAMHFDRASLSLHELGTVLPEAK